MKRAWSARTITAIWDPKKRRIANFAEEFLEFLLDRWDSWTASDLTGCVFICVLIGLSLTTSLLRSAGHAVSCCHVTWRKILRLKWRQVVAIRALFLFSFISFEMTEKYLWPLTDCKCLLCYFHLYFVFLSNVVSNLLFSFEKKVCQLSIINYELSAMTVVKFLKKKKWYSLMWKPPVFVRVTLLYRALY